MAIAGVGTTVFARRFGVRPKDASDMAAVIATMFIRHAEQYLARLLTVSDSSGLLPCFRRAAQVFGSAGSTSAESP
jgi:hypothetical protein